MTSANIDRNALQWRKATKSSTGNCVEVASVEGRIAVRNSRRPDGELIIYSIAEFDAFVDGVKKGEFDELIR